MPTVKELRARAEEAGIQGAAEMKKTELEEALAARRGDLAEEAGRRAGRPLVDLTVQELRALASDLDVPASGRKDDLIRALGHDPGEMDAKAREEATRAIVARENAQAIAGDE